MALSDSATVLETHDSTAVNKYALYTTAFQSPDVDVLFLSDGLLALELYAGPEAQMIGVDRIPCKNFVAVWEQAEFNAVTNEALNRIHFELADGSRIQNAFVYDWRLWSPIELTDLLLECGFRDSRLYRKQKTDGSEPATEVCTRANVPNHWEVYVVGFR